MSDSKPPTVRALIARTDDRGYLLLRVIPKEQMPDWAVLGWDFIATDPQDQEDLILWYKQQWEI